MQALRSLVGKAGLLRKASRSMTSAAQLASEGSKGHGSMVDTIGVYTVTPLAVGVFIYDAFIHPEEEFEGEVPPYPYMRMRTREGFPWGENGLFEIHRVVGEKPS